jgi:hypothetical protein
MKKLFMLILLIMSLLLTACGPNSGLQINTPAPNPTSIAPGEVTIPSMNLQVNAPGPNPLARTPDANGQVAGALLGLWHGFISPVTLILSLTNPGTEMYEVHNEGGPYNLGFLLGILALVGILGGVIGSRMR